MSFSFSNTVDCALPEILLHSWPGVCAVLLLLPFVVYSLFLTSAEHMPMFFLFASVLFL